MKAKFIFIIIVCLILFAACGHDEAKPAFSKDDVNDDITSMKSELVKIAEKIDISSNSDDEYKLIEQLIACLNKYRERLFFRDAGPLMSWSIDVVDRNSGNSVFSQLETWEGEVDVILEVMSNINGNGPSIAWDRRIKCKSKESVYLFLLE